MNRRQLLVGGIAIGTGGLSAPAIAQTSQKLRVGCLHVVAVDGHLLTGLDRGSFHGQGLEFEISRFSSGPEVFEAMARGELDVLSAGGVIANYLGLGQGKAFLINNIEVATAQLWGRPDKGVRAFADLKGKRIATTKRTTAHIFLDRALRANNIQASEVEIVDRPMSAAVASFIAGEVAAVALWVPFNVAVQSSVPEAVKLVDASAYYPQSAVVGGWVASDALYQNGKETLVRIIRGWKDANDYMVRNRSAVAVALQKNHYSEMPLGVVTESLSAQKIYSSGEWKRLYSDGTVVKWLQQVTDFFMLDAKVTGAKPASEYFDPSLYLSVV